MDTNIQPEQPQSFYQEDQVELNEIPIGDGVPFGIKKVSHPTSGIGGAYGTWGEGYDNPALFDFIGRKLGKPLSAEEKMDLASLGFVSRHHTGDLTDEQQLDLEVAFGAHLLTEAAHASGWETGEVEGVLIGTSAPLSTDFTRRIARQAGISETALTISVHKACDSSVGGLHLALNPDLPENNCMKKNVAKELWGKKVLVGGIEGLSRYVQRSRDIFAYQLFGNGAGVIGVIPGKTLKFLVGKIHEVFDEQGVLSVAMTYPHSGKRVAGQSLVEVTGSGEDDYQVSGLMHETDDGTSISMAGPMGMVKLFVRTGVQVVKDAYLAYQDLMKELGQREKNIRVTIVHHANKKINALKAKHLANEGIPLSMPWIVSEFGNVSAASNMIAFLRELPSLRPGDHILIDGFGAGTYYDVLAVEIGESHP
jgi:3-oxoacyl-[acyl-carrier-protein] synthase III